MEVQNLCVVGYKKSAKSISDDRQAITSTLYNPVKTEMPKLDSPKQNLEEVGSNFLVIPALAPYDHPQVDIKYGKYPQGSVLAVHQKLHSDFLLIIFDGVEFPQLPVHNKMGNNYCHVLSQQCEVDLEGLSVSKEEVHYFEENTRLQSNSPVWHRLRSHRLNATKSVEYMSQRTTSRQC